jgi:thiol-disulfide isomerase/thioredoxin
MDELFKILNDDEFCIQNKVNDKNIIEISGQEEFNNFLLNNKDNIILLYFGALWCGPCKKLKQKLNDPSEMTDFKNILVAYIDIDDEENQFLIDFYQITNIPVLIFTKLNENKLIILDKVIGYDWPGLKFKAINLLNTKN